MEKRRVKAKKVLKDVLAEMDDLQIMRKHGLTPKQLETILRGLVERGMITHLQLYERTTLTESTIRTALEEEVSAMVFFQDMKVKNDTDDSDGILPII
jgi:hypothetical protein